MSSCSVDIEATKCWKCRIGSTFIRLEENVGSNPYHMEIYQMPQIFLIYISYEDFGTIEMSYTSYKSCQAKLDVCLLICHRNFFFQKSINRITYLIPNHIIYCIIQLNNQACVSPNFKQNNSFHKVTRQKDTKTKKTLT